MNLMNFQIWIMLSILGALISPPIGLMIIGTYVFIFLFRFTYFVIQELLHEYDNVRFRR